MFNVKSCYKNWLIVSEKDEHMHRDGEIIRYCPEYWPTEKQAQAVLDKFQPKHVWERGDVVQCYDGAIVVCVQESGGPIRIFGIGDGHLNDEYQTDVNLNADATFLFNIKDKL